LDELALKLVIGFDSWTEGSHHFVRLVPALAKRGYKLMLIHIGSWGHDQKRPQEEYIGDLLVRDVSYYKGKSFKEILELERPVAVVFLSTRAFAHQAFNRYALHQGIPTLHLYHGLVNVADVTSTARDAFQTNWANQLGLIKSRLVKNLFVLLPKYWRALFETRAPVSNWYWFYHEVYERAIRNCVGVAPPDASTTRGCVYTDIDIRHMMNIYHMPFERVHAVGNPDIARFGLGADSIAVGLDPERPTRNQVVYIATALLESGFVFRSMEEVVANFAGLSAALKEYGFELVVKLHPSQVPTALPSHLRDLGIDVCENDEFVKYLKSSVAVIAEPSSVAMFPALMGLPLFLAQYGPLAEQRYGLALTTYPRARYLSDIGSLRRLLDEEMRELEPERVTAWIDENAGPLPAEEMPDRVGAIIERMVEAPPTRPAQEPQMLDSNAA
jgi:hypothetical protein